MDGAREHQQEPGESGGLRECVEGAERLALTALLPPDDDDGQPYPAEERQMALDFVKTIPPSMMAFVRKRRLRGKQRHAHESGRDYSPQIEKRSPNGAPPARAGKRA